MSSAKMMSCCFFVSVLYLFAAAASAFSPTDYYLISCGSSLAETMDFDNRVFFGQDLAFLAPATSSTQIQSSNLPSSYSPLYQTARAFNQPAQYMFTIADVGVHHLVGGIYVRLFLKDPKFPLRNPKRFFKGLLDQYLTSIAATHFDDQSIDPELPLLLPAALVSLLRVYPALSDHLGYLVYVPKLVSAVAYEASRDSIASESYSSEDDNPQQNSQPPQEHVRLSCLRVLHQLAGSTTCAEAMAATSVGMPQVVPLLMKAIGWQGGSILALETLKRVVVAGNRARDALFAQGLKVGLVEVLLGLLDWLAGGRSGLFSQMNWNESEASIGRVLAIEVLHAFATEGAYCTKVRSILNASDVWNAYKDQRHYLFLPSNAQASPAGVAGLIESSSSRFTYALTASPKSPRSDFYGNQG